MSTPPSGLFSTVSTNALNVTGILQATQIQTTRPMQVSNLVATGLITADEITVRVLNTVDPIEIGVLTTSNVAPLDGELNVTGNVYVSADLIADTLTSNSAAINVLNNNEAHIADLIVDGSARFDIDEVNVAGRVNAVSFAGDGSALVNLNPDLSAKAVPVRSLAATTSVTAASASVTGAVSAGSLSAGSVSVSGATSTGSLAVGGTANAVNINVSQVVTSNTNISEAGLFSFSSTSNVLNANEINVADLYLNGTLTVNGYRVTPNLLSNLIALVLAANPSFQF